MGLTEIGLTEFGVTTFGVSTFRVTECADKVLPEHPVGADDQPAAHGLGATVGLSMPRGYPKRPDLAASDSLAAWTNQPWHPAREPLAGRRRQRDARAGPCRRT